MHDEHIAFSCTAVQVSLNQSAYTVSEQDGEANICLVLTGQLDRPISIELILSNDTADTSDFNSDSLVYTFASGSDSGAIECNVVGINMDSIVENEERFSVSLQENPEDGAVIIAQGEGEVFIEDSSIECKGQEQRVQYG